MVQFRVAAPSLDDRQHVFTHVAICCSQLFDACVILVGAGNWNVQRVLDVRPPKDGAQAAQKRKWDVLVDWEPTWEPYGNLLCKKHKARADTMVSEALKRSHSI